MILLIFYIYFLFIHPDKKQEEIETLKIVLNPNLPHPSLIDQEKINYFKTNKLILGYLNAYYNHCPIKVSPNAIWQLILNAFSLYVNVNSEKLREKFVDFQGKKTLQIYILGKIENYLKDKELIIEKLIQSLSENLERKLIDILTPNFSTSTEETIFAGKVSIMSAFKKYFNYEAVYYLCGIPYIILEGKLEDWEKILQKLQYLSKFGFINKKMEKDIEEIIKTKKGDINLKFWRNIIMETENIMMKQYDLVASPIKKVIKGWICDFYPTMDVGKYSNKLVDEILEVP